MNRYLVLSTHSLKTCPYRGQETHEYRPFCGEAIDLSFEQSMIVRDYLRQEHMARGETAGIRPLNFQPRAIFFDMDATAVIEETLDLVAEKLGLGEVFAQTTQRAMAGQLDFRTSLENRVALLRGLPLCEVEEVRERITLRGGLLELITSCRQHEIASFLLSGGFTVIAAYVKQQTGMNDYAANRFVVDAQGLLTGEVMPPIVDAQWKREWLMKQCADRAINPKNSVAIGDGANDLLMMQEAGLAIGQQAKKPLHHAIDAQNMTDNFEFIRIFLGL